MSFKVNNFIILIICIAVLYMMLYILNIYLTNIVEQNENTNLYVSSRGILKSCDVHSENPISSIKNFDIDISKITDNSLVYVTGSAVPSFAKELHKISATFILVSGDSDESIPGMIFNMEEFTKFIESDKIICWYAQNCTVTHPKLKPIPIGLDYHTLARNAQNWGKKQSQNDQENELIAIENNSLPFYEREIKCYSNFHFNTKKTNKFNYDRTDAIKKIPKDLVFYEPNIKSRSESWKKQTEFAFVLSPHGNGLDCHRTWEALCLGCIPIVKSSSIDSIYDKLPVLIVDDWSDINIDLLSSTIKSFREMRFDYNRLKLEYWVNLIKASRPYA